MMQRLIGALCSITRPVSSEYLGVEELSPLASWSAVTEVKKGGKQQIGKRVEDQGREGERWKIRVAAISTKRL